jgi:acyl-CoA thioesterase YciA
VRRSHCGGRTDDVESSPPASDTLASVKAMTSPIDPHAHDPALRTIAMPADANPDGDIFGGWLLSQMDMAGGSAALERARGRVVTVAIEGMNFHEPVEVGDEVSCYTHLVRVGRTSLTIHVEAWKRRRDQRRRTKVTEGDFTYVKIDSQRRPVPIGD